MKSSSRMVVGRERGGGTEARSLGALRSSSWSIPTHPPIHPPTHSPFSL